jgi:hypothetical protein
LTSPSSSIPTAAATAALCLLGPLPCAR